MGASIPCSVAPKPVVVDLLERADRFAEDGQLDHASAFFRAAVVADQTPVARLAYGCFLADCEREVLARSHLIEAWEMAKRLHLPAIRALACHNLAALSRRQGHTAAANSYQQQAIQASLEADPLSPLPGYILAGRGLDFAVSESVAAEKLFHAARLDPAEEIAALYNAGVVSVRQGRVSLAIRRMYAAFELAEAAKDLSACAAILAAIARIHTDQGRWSVANECLILAESIDRRAGRAHRADELMAIRMELARGLARLTIDPSWN